MKKYIVLVMVLASCFSVRAPAQCPTIQVYFSSGDSIERMVVNAIDSAQSQILVQAFDLTADTIVSALKRAHRRDGRNGHKVQVKVLVDKRTESHKSLIESLEKAGISTRVDQGSDLAHNKIMIIDAVTVITGSYNWTNHAKKNAENLLVIHDSTVARQYLDNWFERRSDTRKAVKHPKKQ